MKANVTVRIKGPDGNLLRFSAVLTTEYSDNDHPSPAILIVQQDNQYVTVRVEPNVMTSTTERVMVDMWNAEAEVKSY